MISIFVIKRYRTLTFPSQCSHRGSLLISHPPYPPRHLVSIIIINPSRQPRQLIILNLRASKVSRLRVIRAPTDLTLILKQRLNNLLHALLHKRHRHAQTLLSLRTHHEILMESLKDIVVQIAIATLTNAMIEVCSSIIGAMMQVG